MQITYISNKNNCLKYVPCEKIRRITKIEVLANHPSNRYKNAVKYYKAGHNNG